MSSSLTPNLKSVVIGLARADQKEKQAKKEKSDYRSQLFHIATLERGSAVLPQRTIKIPVGFLNKIGMQENHFLVSRYPGWRKIQSRKVNDAGVEDREGKWIEYLLERDPALMPYTTQAKGDGFTVIAGRSIQQNDPELDQRSLQKDLPEVYDAIMVPKVVYEVNEDKLKALLSERPDLLPQIELHLAYPNPIAKLTPIKEIAEGEDG